MENTNRGTHTQEQFRNDHSKITTALGVSMGNVVVDGHSYSVNFGSPLSESTGLVLPKHYAPISCDSYVDPSSQFNKIDPDNPCIKQFLMVLPESLIKEAMQALESPGEMSDKYQTGSYLKRKNCNC